MTLWLLIFTLYSQPLSDVIVCHSCDYHKYTDDTEISDSAPPSDFTSAQSNIQSCISDTLSWMQSNKLNLNTHKTEMMLVGSSVRISLVGCESADIDGSCIPFQTTIMYLGVHLDQTLSMKWHISSLCHTTFLALRRITSIRLFLSNSSVEKLVASIITSRLDYCNAAFAGVANEQIARIQKIQNNAAWLILKKSKRDHVTPLLKELHWLPVKYCIRYKLTTLTFRHFDGTLLPCLSSSLCTYQPSRSLHSSTESLLKIPKTNLKTFSERSFGYIAPTVWYSLPADLRASPSLPTFKVNLKTHFFRQAFGLICTCQPLPVSYSCICVCVCVCVCVSVGGGGRDWERWN